MRFYGAFNNLTLSSASFVFFASVLVGRFDGVWSAGSLEI